MNKVFIGILLIGAGIFLLLYYRKKVLASVEAIQFTQSSTIASIYERWRNLKSEGLSGNYREFVEISGIAHVENPQNTTFSGTACAFYKSEFNQVYEEQTQHVDSRGHRSTRMQRRESLISSENSHEALLIKDASTDEKILLDISQEKGLMDALNNTVKIDLIKNFDRFEPVNNMHAYSFFSGLSFRPMGARTLGYKMTEWIIPLEHPLYVLGEVYERGDMLCLGKPADAAANFVISTKSESQLITDAKNKALYTTIGGIAAIVIGVFFIFS